MTERKYPYSRQNFLDRKVLSDKIEEYATQRLIEAGIDAHQPFMVEGLPVHEYTKHQIDIIANGRIIEVKGRSVDFESVETFPHSTIFVEGCSGFDKKERRPDFFINVSHQTGTIIALDVERTIDTWTVDRVRDNRRNFSYKMYVSQTQDWINFDELVRRLSK